MVRLRPSSLISTGYVAPLRIDCYAGSGRVGRVWLAGRNPLKYSAMTGNWTRATGRTDSEIHSFSQWAIMTRAMERTDSEIHSFSHWAIMTRATESTDSEIHSFSHWAIMTRAMERTDSEIHSFSHWAIMTRATESTGSEIHSFSHWAIMIDMTNLVKMTAYHLQMLVNTMPPVIRRSPQWVGNSGCWFRWYEWNRNCESQG